MKSTFIQVVWGIYNNESGYKDNHWFTRRSKIDNDIKLFQLNPYSPKSIVFVYGSDNYKRLTDLGLECRLIDNKPFVFDLETEQYAHKLYGWDYALKEFDSIIAIDFDLVALKPLPIDFWDVMNSGSPIKSPLYVYHIRRVNRPPNDLRKVSSASFTYIRGKEHSQGIINMWKDMDRPWKEELPLSAYIDYINGGWKGVEGYKNCDVPFYQMSDIKELPKDKDNICFYHYNARSIKSIIGDGTDIKDRLDMLAKDPLRRIK